MPRKGLTIVVPPDRRQAERFTASMPVRVDSEQGTTHDLSTMGLSFHADHPFEPGAQVDVVIEYLLDGHHYPLRSRAEVVRSVPDREGDGYTIGARLVRQARTDTVELGGSVPEPLRRHLRRVD